MIDTGDILILTNADEERVLEVKLRGKLYRVEPEKHALVPFELIRVWWGDPRSKPQRFVPFSDSLESGWVNKRELEIRRLGVLYGTYASSVAELLNPEWPRGSARFGTPRRTPHPITVRTEDGADIVPACFDRTGNLSYAVVNTEVQDLSDEVAYREHLEAQLDAITRRLDKLGGASDVEVDGATAGV